MFCEFNWRYNCARSQSKPQQAAALEPRRRQLGVTHRMLNILVPEIVLYGSGIDAVVRQLEPTSVPKHVRMNLHVEASRLASALDHRLEAAFGEWHPAFTDEDEW